MSTVLRPRSLDEALTGLRDAGPDTKLLAGGTDLMVEWQTGRTERAEVVDLWKVDELRGIDVGPDAIRLGALTTCTDLLRCASIQDELDVLIASAREVGAVQIQNRATLGGNLGTASPAADMTPVLFALDAKIELASTAGSRTLPVTEFIRGYRETARRPDELIAAVHLPRRSADEVRAFRKVGTRRAQSISKLVVAACATRPEPGRCTALRIAAGSIAASTVLLPGLADEVLAASRKGRLDAKALVEAARRCARDEVSPIDDVRSTGAYRRQTLARVLGRLLVELCG